MGTSYSDAKSWSTTARYAAGVGAFKDFFQQFFVAGKRTDEVEPEMFYPAEQMAGAGQPLGVSAEQFLVKIVEAHFSYLSRLLRIAFYFLGKKRIAESAPAEHPAVDVGKAVCERSECLYIIDIAVVGERVVAELPADVKAIRICCPFIELFAKSGMDNYLF